MFDGARLSDLDEILPNLWMGGHPKNVAEFQYVFCLVSKCAYKVESHQTVTIAPFEDVTEQELNGDFLHELADQVLRCHQRGKTLVHCEHGLNRSALVVALALVKLGYTPADAVAHVKAVRYFDALNNRTFNDWLMKQDAAGDPRLS